MNRCANLGKNANRTMEYIGNAFSLQMLDTSAMTNIMVTPVSRDEIPASVKSVVGHADTAAVLGVPFNRESVRLAKGDILYVAQITGGRLPEGTTTLPEGFNIVFLKVEVL